MTTSIKSVNHHENFVKAIVPSEKQIAKLAEFGYDEEITKLFVNAVNWISVNDNDRKSMRFFKKNQQLVDLGLAETFEEDGNTYMRLTNKAVKVMQGRKNKINVSSEPRQKIKQSKGYTAKAEIPAEVQEFLDRTGWSVRSTELMKPTYNLRVHKEGTSRAMLVAIYENDVKFCFFGKYKQDMMNHVLSLIPSDLVLHQKMSNTFGFILVKQSDLVNLTEEMFTF